METQADYEIDTTPHSREAEEAVLGGVLIAPNTLDEINLQAGDFYNQRCRFVWDAITNLKKTGFPVDILTVSNRLAATGKLDEVGGDAYLTMLMGRCPSSLEVPSYARMVTDDALRRRMLSAASRVTQLAYDRSKNADDALDEAERELSRIETPGQSRTITMSSGIKAAYDITEAASKGKVRTVKTGFADIDQVVVLQAPDLAIVAGRPGSGKTAWLLSVADNITDKGGKVLLFSLEMSVAQVHMRLNAMHSGVSVKTQREGRLSADEWERYNQAVSDMSYRKLYINDTSAITLREIRQAIRAINGIDLVIVDYLQLMTPEGRNENRTQEVGRISQGLKAIAKDFDIPVLAAAQLSRAVEQRADKDPQLSDLRESGSLEQDASVVWFISRKAMDSTEADFKTAKNRDGAVGFCKLQFIGSKSRFESQARGGF